MTESKTGDLLSVKANFPAGPTRLYLLANRGTTRRSNSLNSASVFPGCHHLAVIDECVGNPGRQIRDAGNADT